MIMSGQGCGSREIDPEPKGDGGVSDKTGSEGCDQQFGDSDWHSRDSVPSPGPAKENNHALELQKEYTVSGYWQLKRKSW